MDITKFGGIRRHLRVEDLKGKPREAIIDDCQTVDFGGERKPALILEGKKKILVLNKTNIRALVKELSKETACWHGTKIELYPDKTKFDGKEVLGIRLRVLEPGKEVPVTAAMEAAQENDDW
jgi:hypothetical protein